MVNLNMKMLELSGVNVGLSVLMSKVRHIVDRNQVPVRRRGRLCMAICDIRTDGCTVHHYGMGIVP